MTAALLLAPAWVGLVLVAARRHRPAPARVRALLPGRPGRALLPARLPGRALVSAPSIASAPPGSSLRERLARRLPARLPRRSALVALAAAVCLPVVPAAAPVVAIGAWWLPIARARRAERRQLAAFAADLPDVVDLVVLAVDAGLTVPLAVAAVARRAEGPLGAELCRVCDEHRLGRRLADALDDLPARAGESVRPLVTALVASERYGAPLSAGLGRLADDVRRQRRRRAEEAARRVPVKLLFPLVTCTLPAFALLTVAPLVAGALRQLHP